MHRRRPFAAPRGGRWPVHRAAPLVVAVTIAALALAGACKRESEPDWPYGPPPGGLADIGTVREGGAGGGAVEGGGPAGHGGADVVAPPEDVAAPSDGDAVGDGAAPDDAATEVAGDAASVDAGPVTLPEEMEVALRRPVAAADREVAERETGKGRALHERLQLREALGHYRLALERMPAHPHANYLAARALALLGQREASLRHLLALAFVDTETARSLLAEARGERDFRSLWPDPTWRRLTGFGTIGVAVVGGAPANQALGAVRDRVIRRLTEARLPAEAATEPGVGQADDRAPVILYRAGSETLAQAVSRTLGGVSLQRGADLPTDVLVLWRADASPPPAGDVTLDALLDHRLQARDERGLRQLRLRSTGYFEAENRSADGAEVRRRRGRYRVDGDALVLTYKETVERYPEGADVPEIETREGSETIPFMIGPGRQLVIDGLAYRPQ